MINFLKRTLLWIIFISGLAVGLVFIFPALFAITAIGGAGAILFEDT